MANKKYKFIIDVEVTEEMEQSEPWQDLLKLTSDAQAKQELLEDAEGIVDLSISYQPLDG